MFDSRNASTRRHGARAWIAAFALLSLAFVLPTPAVAQGTWTSLVNPNPTPTPRREFAAIYDPDHQRYLIFGGFTNAGGYQLFNEVWVLSLTGSPTWTFLDIQGQVPGPRHSPQWGYDGARNRLLIFGGYGKHLPGDPTYTYLNDVWQLRLQGQPNWVELTTVGTPPAGRLAGAAVYDPMRQRFVGFGGTAGLPVDTWALNLFGQPSWETLDVGATSPPGSYGMTSVYDAKRDRMVIFGGSTSDDYFGVHNNVWELTLRDEVAWHQLEPAGTLPAPRRSGTAIYDPLRDRMVIFGGWDNLSNQTSSFLDDVWALPFEGPLAWTQLAPAGVVPEGRDVASAIYDPNVDRLVVFGGWSGTTMLGDTQFLSWGGAGTAATMTPEVTGSTGTANVQWQVADAVGPHAAVYRRDEGGEWTSLATAEVSGGVLSYDDATVEPGHHYDYMMVVGSERGESFGGTVGVDVTGALGVGDGRSFGFALQPIAPNPVGGRFSASFTLPGREPASLELVDVAGRRVMQREVGSLGAGVHRVEFAARDLPTGLYFVRLSQAGRSAVERVVVTGP